MNRIGRNDPCHCGSGKKYKQCCMQRDEGQSSHSPSRSVPSMEQIAMAVQTALQHHQQGRFAEAESIYRQVLKIDPTNFDALHMLGVLAHQVGQHAQSVDLIGQAIWQDASDPLAHNNLGNAYRALGRHDEALASFQKALSIKPDFYQVQNNVGETYRVMGRLEDAIASFSEVLKIEPNYAEAHNNMGLALFAQNRYDEAIACFNKALALKPDYAKAYNNLGNVLSITGKPDEAQQCHDKALSINPNLPEALVVMGTLLKAQGNVKKALLCMQRAVQVQPTETGYWYQYADILKVLSHDAVDMIHVPTLLQAFDKENIDPQKLEPVSVALISNDEHAKHLLAMANEDENGAQKIETELSAGRLKTLMEMPLLLQVLENTVVTSYRLEKLLTAIRRAVLALTVREHKVLDDHCLQRFMAALAQQCFTNEYIYAMTADEMTWQSKLQQQIAASIDTDSHRSVPALMLLGAYQALYRQGFAEKLQAIRAQDKFTQAVLQRQLVEPLEERTIRSTIPNLSDIGNATSQAVRQQYEENPYPRWRRRGVAGQGQPVHRALQLRFPHQVFPADSPQAPDILIAGCGTGSDAVQIAQSFQNANIVAIDLSLTSLAYAKRATREFGISNIEFLHADILEAGKLDRQFDVIVSSGVLHHMRDPLAGWRTLVGLLRPAGYMNIGLYSRRARHEVTRMRELIKEKGYPSTVEGIRQFRADVMSKHASIDIGTLALTPDFYSTSACRDLVFHVEEHLFSPLEIQACMKQLGLQFLGFEFANPQAHHLYQSRYPENVAADILENWEQLEIERPEIFAGMYQFWVRKTM